MTGWRWIGLVECTAIIVKGDEALGLTSCRGEREREREKGKADVDGRREEEEKRMRVERRNMADVE